MEIIEACKTIFWICLAVCSIVIASHFIVSFIRTNKQVKNKENLEKIAQDMIVSSIAKEYGDFVKKTLENEMKKQKKENK